ncbi:hypothetical protein BDZ85DRAFT_314815 [Elsinoe ampelina]|uniref:Uncharacterized protein n=1 Tax=Elsinoe ampelina TaxID=302913 RepID=A0A6A6GNL3_9PEZI|nr:hypothetical protein BDZ85DRAFT_314815 [Elsinoe ampelina]
MARNGDLRSLFKSIPTKRRSPEALDYSDSESVRDLDAITTSTAQRAIALASDSQDVSGTSHLTSHHERASLMQDSHASSSPTRTRALLEMTFEDSDEDNAQAPSRTAPTEQVVEIERDGLPPTVRDPSSSLSSPDPSPKPPEAFPGQRLDNDGQDMVTNSSSDAVSLSPGVTDMEGEVEDDEIEALISARTREVLNERQSRASNSESEERTGHDLRYARRPTKRQRTGAASYPTPPKQNGVKDIQSTLARIRKHEEVEQNIKDMDEQVRQRQERNEAMEKILDTGGDDNGELAANVDQALDNDQEGGYRVKRALKAMSAMEHEVRFHFFDTVFEVDETRQKFPGSMGKADYWVELLNDDRKREQAAESGFIADMCRYKPLPAELQEWFLGEIIFEEREHLSHAYVQILVECAQHETTLTALDLVMLRDSMTRLGARNDIVDECYVGEEDPSTFEARRKAKIGRQGLFNFLGLLSQLKDKLTMETLSAALFYCCLILVDNDVSQVPRLLGRTEQTVSDLFTGVPESDKQTLAHNLADNLLNRLNHPVLVSRLLTRIPSLNTTAALFKRQAAFLATTSCFPKAEHLSSPACWREIQKAIQADNFKPNDKTDYASLAARFATLDLAIGPGFSSFSFLPPPPSRDQHLDPPATTMAEDTTPQDKRHTFFHKRTAPEEPCEEEQAFNDMVQWVVKRARKIDNGIRDAGAVALRKTECKGVIEGMVRRLEGQVRTRKKKERGMFTL